VRCTYCQSEFKSKNRLQKYCSKKCYNNAKQSRHTKKTGSGAGNKIVRKACSLCGTWIERAWRTGQKFCSMKCTGASQSISYKENLEIVEKLRIYGAKGGKHQNTNRRSKNEIHFSNLCKSHFKVVLDNPKMFNGWDVDVVIDDIRVAVLWNGPWHYKPNLRSNHSLVQIQNRDRFKVENIKKCGYFPYVIKDMGKESISFVQSEFQKFLLEIEKNMDPKFFKGNFEEDFSLVESCLDDRHVGLAENCALEALNRIRAEFVRLRDSLAETQR
jgi:hypothetical protein